jgi:Ca-activated chloride channel homolog
MDRTAQAEQLQLLSCVPEFAEVAAGRSRAIGVVVSFAAPNIADDNERLPIRLSAVLDKSGSMAGAKLELVKATTRFLVHQLLPSDSLGIVCYDTDVST